MDFMDSVPGIIGVGIAGKVVTDTYGKSSKRKRRKRKRR
jgi:hypothetical protein